MSTINFNLQNEYNKYYKENNKEGYTKDTSASSNNYTNVQKQNILNTKLKLFETGCLTVKDFLEALKSLGISTKATSSKEDHQTVMFEFNNKKYAITCNSEAEACATDNKKVETFTIAKLKINKLSDKAVLEKYFDAVEIVNGTVNTYALKDGYKSLADVKTAVYQETKNKLVLDNFVNKNVNKKSDYVSALNKTSSGATLTSSNYTTYKAQIDKAVGDDVDRLKQEALNKFIKEFAQGNIAYSQVSEILTAIGVTSRQQKLTNGKYNISFEFNGKKYNVTCNKTAASKGTDKNTVTTYSAEDLKKTGADQTIIDKYFDKTVVQDDSTVTYVLKSGKKYNDFLNEANKSYSYQELQTYYGSSFVSNDAKEHFNKLVDYFFDNKNGGYIIKTGKTFEQFTSMVKTVCSVDNGVPDNTEIKNYDYGHEVRSSYTVTSGTQQGTTFLFSEYEMLHPGETLVNKLEDAGINLDSKTRSKLLKASSYSEYYNIIHYSSNINVNKIKLNDDYVKALFDSDNAASKQTLDKNKFGLYNCNEYAAAEEMANILKDYAAKIKEQILNNSSFNIDSDTLDTLIQYSINSAISNQDFDCVDLHDATNTSTYHMTIIDCKFVSDFEDNLMNSVLEYCLNPESFYAEDYNNVDNKYAINFSTLADSTVEHNPRYEIPSSGISTASDNQYWCSTEEQKSEILKSSAYRAEQRVREYIEETAEQLLNNLIAEHPECRELYENIFEEAILEMNAQISTGDYIKRDYVERTYEVSLCQNPDNGVLLTAAKYYADYSMSHSYSYSKELVKADFIEIVNEMIDDRQAEFDEIEGNPSLQCAAVNPFAGAPTDVDTSDMNFESTKDAKKYLESIYGKGNVSSMGNGKFEISLQSEVVYIQVDFSDGNITYTDQHSISYTYDKDGNKVSMSYQVTDTSRDAGTIVFYYNTDGAVTNAAIYQDLTSTTIDGIGYQEVTETEYHYEYINVEKTTNKNRVVSYTEFKNGKATNKSFGTDFDLTNPYAKLSDTVMNALFKINKDNIADLASMCPEFVANWLKNQPDEVIAEMLELIEDNIGDSKAFEKLEQILNSKDNLAENVDVSTHSDDKTPEDDPNFIKHGDEVNNGVGETESTEDTNNNINDDASVIRSINVPSALSFSGWTKQANTNYTYKIKKGEDVNKVIEELEEMVRTKMRELVDEVTLGFSSTSFYFDVVPHFIYNLDTSDNTLYYNYCYEYNVNYMAQEGMTLPGDTSGLYYSEQYGWIAGLDDTGKPLEITDAQITTFRATYEALKQGQFDFGLSKV